MLKIKIYHSRSKKETLIFRKAAQFYFNKLVKDDGNCSVSIILKPAPEIGGEKVKAYTFKKKINFYEICLDNNFSIKKMLSALAHEMVHVKQYFTCQLFDSTESLVSWKAKMIDTEKVAYFDQPWEVESYRREKYLVRKFKEYCKKNGIEL